MAYSKCVCSRARQLRLLVQVSLSARVRQVLQPVQRQQVGAGFSVLAFPLLSLLSRRERSSHWRRYFLTTIQARRLHKVNSPFVVNLRHSRVARAAFALLASGVCLFLIQAAARTGFSRLLTRYAIGANSPAAADQAIQLTPADPDAHRARATVLTRLGRFEEAEWSLETATSLRPSHAAQWLELGTTREELGDNEGALAAFDEAIRCAPYYGQTHWQRGNLLLRLGRYDEAFADLSQAAASNRKFLPNVIDLVWGLTKEDTKQTEALLQINNDIDRLEFARFLARKGRGNEVFEQTRLLATPLSDENTQELTRLLFAARDFSVAYHLSAGVQPAEKIINGGFEQPLLLNGSPLGWVLSHPQTNPKLAIDVSEKNAGQRSLQVSFAGEWDTSRPALEQTVVVQSGQRYRLSFAAKTKDLVTGGPPRIVLTDAMNHQILVKSDVFPESTPSWQQMTVEFTVPQSSEAVVISLARDNCSSSLCPIFGVVWLDEFVLQKL